MSNKSSIAIFIAATSALAISSANSNVVKAGENDIGGLKEWNTDMPVSADFILDKNAQKIIQAVFPDRKITAINGIDISLGGGNIHCITQQQPLSL